MAATRAVAAIKTRTRLTAEAADNAEKTRRLVAVKAWCDKR